MTPSVAEIVAALHSIRPGAQWVLRGTDMANIEWNDQVQIKPTQSEITAEITRLSDLGVSPTYGQDRAGAYPPIGEQLDMLWHAIDAGKLDQSSDFYKAIAAVKARYPKAGGA